LSTQIIAIYYHLKYPHPNLHQAIAIFQLISQRVSVPCQHVDFPAQRVDFPAWYISSHFIRNSYA
jgi:hypothetical protein